MAMLGLCTKHCTWLVLIAMVLTIALQGVPSLLHIPLGGQSCVNLWGGWPFGYINFSTVDMPECMGAAERFLNFFVNGLLNVILFFLPLRFLHDKFLHQKPRISKA